MALASTQIDLIAGLGNPGPDYTQTRHNAGFWFVEHIARSQNKFFSSEQRFFGETCKVTIDGRSVRLLKPTTFMNRSGQSVAALARYFKIPPENILIVHDELDLPPGDARIKFAGGHGGHNGLRDLIDHLGGNGFWRIRLGISHPGTASQVIDYVLKHARKAEQDLIDEAIASVLNVMPLIVNGDIQKAINQVHSRKPKPLPPNHS